MRADGVLVTWCLRRNIVAALLASAGVVAAASFLPVVVPTPQLRGGGLEAATALLTSFAVAMCFVPTITAGDLALEERSPRPVRAARIGFGALLLGVTAALVAVGVLVRGGDAAGVAAAVRTLSLASALGLAAARLGGLVAGFAATLAYLGCCLFAGAAPDGTVEPWARPLAGWQMLPDALLLAAAAVVVLTVFAARPARTRARAGMS